MALALQLGPSTSTVHSCRSGVTTKQKPIFESPEYALKQRQHHEHMLRQLQPQYHPPPQFHPPSEVPDPAAHNYSYAFTPSNRGLQLPSTASSASSDPPLWSPPSSNLSAEAEQFGLSMDNTTPMQSQSKSKSAAEKYPTPAQAPRTSFQEANSVYGQLVDSPHAGNVTWPFQDPSLPGPYSSYGGSDPNAPLYQFPASYPSRHPVFNGSSSNTSYAQPLLGMDMGMFGAPFRGQDGTFFEMQPHVISTEWLRNSPRNSMPTQAQAHVPVPPSPNMHTEQQEREQVETEAPPSPLRPLSPSLSIDSFLSAGAVEASMQVGSSPKFSRSRLLSDSDIGESLETSTAAEIRSRRPRSHSWTSPVIVARRKSHALLGYSREDGLRELEMLEEEHGGSLNRPDKRRLQNRIAQRAFRARSKVHHADLAGHMAHLEFLKVTQQERITQMSAIIEKQRREILALRKGERNKRSAVPLPGNRLEDDDGD